VPRHISEYGLRQNDLEDIVDHALKDVVIRACPIPLSREDLRNVLQQAW
jgi:alcohol dehydrogenase class IV